MEKLADISIFNSLTKTTRIHNDLSPWEPGGWSPFDDGGEEGKRPKWTPPGYAEAKEKAMTAGGMAWVARKGLKAWNNPQSPMSRIRARLVSGMSGYARDIEKFINDFGTQENPLYATVSCDLIISACKELQKLAYQASKLPDESYRYGTEVDNLHRWVQHKNRARREGRP